MTFSTRPSEIRTRDAGPLRALVALKDETQQVVTSRLLDQNGIVVEAASTLEALQEGLSHFDPDVVLLQLADVDEGTAFIRQVRTSRPTVPIVFAAHAVITDRLFACAEGGPAFPIDPALLGASSVLRVVTLAAEHRRLAAKAEQLQSHVDASEPLPDHPTPTLSGFAELADFPHELLDLPYADAKRQLLQQFDRAYTGEALKRTGGNTSAAARQAGLDRSNFRRVLRRHKAAS